jgi:hypothetical protein
MNLEDRLLSLIEEQSVRVSDIDIIRIKTDPVFCIHFILWVMSYSICTSTDKWNELLKQYKRTCWWKSIKKIFH